MCDCASRPCPYFIVVSIDFACGAAYHFLETFFDCPGETNDPQNVYRRRQRGRRRRRLPNQ